MWGASGVWVGGWGKRSAGWFSCRHPTFHSLPFTLLASAAASIRGALLTNPPIFPHRCQKLSIVIRHWNHICSGSGGWDCLVLSSTTQEDKYWLNSSLNRTSQKTDTRGWFCHHMINISKVGRPKVKFCSFVFVCFFWRGFDFIHHSWSCWCSWKW